MVTKSIVAPLQTIVDFVLYHTSFETNLNRVNAYNFII